MDIRFIAADMDGTLLDSQKQLSPHFFPVLRQLLRLGISFAAASGRQYDSLLRTFAPVKDEILFISENGAMVMQRGQCVCFYELPADTVRGALLLARAAPGVMPVLCCEDGAYVEDNDPVFLRNVTPYYTLCTRVSDLLKTAGQKRVCKLAVFDTGDAETGIYPALHAQFAAQAEVCLSGAHWTDLMPKDVNKGRAVRDCQRQLGISPAQCMAFGDYLNDIEMLRACAESYAMGNAHAQVKAACRHTAPTNDEDGVVRVLCDVFGLEPPRV